MEATPEQTAEGLAIVQVLSAVLERLVSANTSTARTDPGQVTKFHAMKAPGIGVQQYLERIHKFASCSNECFILALIYIDRLIQRNNFLLTELNVHRVVITAILLAAKFFDDAYYNNAYYAKVGGVVVSEMNGLEVDFLFRINFSLHVTPEVFQKYRAQLLSQAASTGIAVSPPVKPVVHSPIVNHLPVMAPQRQVSAPVPATHYADHVALVQSARNSMPMDVASQITPSPPPTEAGRSVDDLVFQHQDVVMAPATLPAELFVPMQRANSLPVTKSHYYGVQQTTAMVPTRCSPQSFSAPPVPVGALRCPTGDKRFVVVDHHIYPIQNTLIHRDFGQPGDTGDCNNMVTREAQHLVTGRMLTGLSGAGF